MTQENIIDGQRVFSDKESIQKRRVGVYSIYLRQLIYAKNGNFNSLMSAVHLAAEIGIEPKIFEIDLNYIDNVLSNDSIFYEKYKQLRELRKRMLNQKAGRVGGPARNAIYGLPHNPKGGEITPEMRLAASRAGKIRIEKHGSPFETLTKEQLREYGQQGYDKTLAGLTIDDRRLFGREGRLKAKYEATTGEQLMIDTLMQLNRYTDVIAQAAHGIFTHYESFVFPDKEYINFLDGTKVIPDFVSFSDTEDTRRITKVIEIYGRSHNERFLDSQGRSMPLHDTDPEEKVKAYAEVGIDAIVFWSDKNFMKTEESVNKLLNWLDKE